MPTQTTFSPAIKGTLKRHLKRRLLLKNRVLVGTHHKTGTVWFKIIFRTIAARLGLVFLDSNTDPKPAANRWDIFQQGHSEFDLHGLSDCRGIHVIRDPRDVIVSGAFYHQTSAEEWLHVPKPQFGGLTYQQKINSFQSLDDKLLFEMEHTSLCTIQGMLRFQCRDVVFTTVKYEDLIADHDLKRFERLFAYLGFRNLAMGWCLAAAYRNSLFSGSIRSSHVRSGRSNQWAEHFKPVHRRRFDELYGDVLEKLGYEPGDAWHALQ